MLPYCITINRFHVRGDNCGCTKITDEMYLSKHTVGFIVVLVVNGAISSSEKGTFRS